MQALKYKAQDSISNWHEFTLFDVLGVLEDDQTYFKVATTSMRLLCRTIEAYTGMHDKNGTPIYNNDIIKSSTPTELQGDTFRIEYRNCFFGATADGTEYEPLFLHAPNCEVIGNMAQNKELLDDQIQSKE